MLRSMTGFGRCETVRDGCRITAEIRSVNHRYCDITVKLPKKLGFLEVPVRNLVREYVARGKVDVFIGYEDETEGKGCLKYNKTVAQEYINAFKEMSGDFSIENDVTVSLLSGCPDVLTMQEETVDEDFLGKIVKECVTAACEDLTKARTLEGEKLCRDLLDKLDVMTSSVSYIEERSPQIIGQYRQRLEDKVRELLGTADIDESRIVMETTIYADKLAVDEEVVRLKSHMENMRKLLTEGGVIGRKLDFVVQEMNREANTVLSKANDLIISDIGIELKTDIEKIREQIQNIE